MARERVRRAEDEETERPRRPAKKSPVGMFGLALVLFVLAAVMLLYTMTVKKPVQEPPRVEQKNPFADLPPEPPPEKQAKTKGQK